MSFENDDVMRVTAKMSIQQQDVINVFHVQNQGAGSIDDGSAHTFVLIRLDAAYSELVALLSDLLNFETVETFNVTQDAPMLETAWLTLDDGDKLDQVLPQQTAALCLFPTGVARSQGRKYLGGFTEDSNADGAIPSPTLVTALGAFVDVLVDNWIIGTGEFVFGNYDGVIFRFAEWISAIVREVWRTQRRRATGVGS